MVMAPRQMVRHGARLGNAQLQGESFDAAQERYRDNAIEHGLKETAEMTGEGLFSKAMMIGLGSFGLNHTLGRLKPNWMGQIAKVTHAPIQALETTSLADFSLKNLKANYWHALSNYGQKHSKHTLAKNPEFYAKAAERAKALGGPVLASGKWEGISKLPKFLMHRGAFSTIMASGLALASGMALYDFGKEVKHDITDIQEVAKDLGEAITPDQFFRHPDSLSPLLRQMRDNLIEHLKTDAVAAGAKVLENTAFAAMGGPGSGGGHGSMFGLPMAGMMGGMLLGHGAQEFKPSQNFTDSYLKVKDAQNAGLPVPTELYADLMEAASMEVRRGGKETEQVQRLAQQYAGEQIAPSALIKEIYAGAPFKQRAKGIYEQMQAEAALEKQDEAPDVVGAHEKPKAVSLKQASHEGKMQASKAAKRPVEQPEAGTPDVSSLVAAAHQGKMRVGPGVQMGGSA